MIVEYGLLIVLKFSSLEACEDMISKIYGIGGSTCIESYVQMATIESFIDDQPDIDLSIDPPLPRPAIIETLRSE